MSSAEFAEWMAYNRMSPFDRQEVLLAQTLTLLANVHRDDRRRPQEYRVDDFLPDPFGPSPAEKRRLIAEGYQKLYAAVAKRRAEKAAKEMAH